MSKFSERWNLKGLLQLQAIVLALALLFTFVGFKVGEQYAPVVRITWEGCDK